MCASRAPQGPHNLPPRPYYEDESCVIYHGDCLDVLERLSLSGHPNFDLVFTSPPYNKGVRTDGNWTGPVTRGSKSHRFLDGYADAMPWDEYREWQRKVVSTLCDHVYPDGALFYNHKPRIINGALWTPLDLIPDDLEAQLRQIIVWNKQWPGVDLQPGAFASAHEWLMFFAWPDYKFPEGKKASAMGDVWSLPADHSRDGHPAPFPEEIVSRAMRAVKPRFVLDPFMGTGSTLAAARWQRGVKAVGIEIEERYCEVAANRLRQGVLTG